MRIEVVAHKGQPIEAFGADFDAAGGSIGREQGNTLVLPDLQRHISRTHAEIVCRGGRFAIVDQGSAIPVILNDRPLGKGREAPLVEGDTITIGVYVLKVGGGRATPAADGIARRAPIPAAPKPPAKPDALVDMFAGAPTSDDPFADLMGGEPSAKSAPAPAPSRPAAAKVSEQVRQSGAATPSAQGAHAHRIPDDFNVFAETIEPSGTGFGGLLPKIDGPVDIDVSQSVDEIIGEARGGSDDPFGLPAPAAGKGLPGGLQEGAIDPLLLYGVSGGPELEQGAPQRNDEPEMHAAFRPPQPAPEARVPPAAQALPPMAVVPATSARTSPDELLAAFLEGAGLPGHEFLGPVTPEMMNLVGELLREAVQGTLDLLGARAATKREIHAEITMIQGKNNNPLKFSPNAQEALAHLLARRGGAYVAPAKAMREAYNDLRSHQVAFMAGVEAALAGVLERFSPAELEQKLSQKSVLESLLPMARKAKLWDLMVELHVDIAKDAEDDFHVLFSKEFLRAYHKQLSDLERQQRLKPKA